MILMTGLLLGMTACASSPAKGGSADTATVQAPAEAESVAEETEPAETEESTTEAPKSRILVAYFSATGHTEPIAEYIAKALNADLYEIVPADPYTSEDLKYGDKNCRASKEQADDTVRPEIAGELPDLSRYDTILIGHPIWWTKAPKIIYTFLENSDLSGKSVTSFCTSESSGLGTIPADLQAIAGDDVTWLNSHRFAINARAGDIKSWLNEIGLE